MLKATACVVIYNPDINLLDNIYSYINQIDKLYVIDNSDKNSYELVLNKILLFNNLKYINNYSNKGISVALNKAAELAIKDGYDLLLTIDQDSKISENFIDKMVKEFENDNRVGVLAPFLVHNKNPKKPKSFSIEEINVAMTSGSMIRLSAYKEIGGFLEKFFIDYVDNEFCLRMHLANYKVLQLNSVFVYHNLGNVTRRNFLIWKVFPTNHSPLRLYYRTRNRFYLYKKYKKQFSNYIIYDKMLFIKEIIKIFLYENNKKEKVKMILKGYVDFRRNNFGKFSL